MADQTYLSKQKAARRLDVSEKTIDRLRSCGKLDWFPVGSLVRISLASLQAYVQRQQGCQHQHPVRRGERLPIPALDAIRAAKAAARASLRNSGEAA